MKIFNNFDSEIVEKELQEAISSHGEDNVILCTRYVAFWILKWIIPFVLILILNVVSIYWVSQIETSFIAHVLYWIIVILDLIYLYKLFNLRLDYTYDHTIITPEAITTYKQKWILDSKLKELPTAQIKSTQSYRSWMLWNIFSYWVIEILTDWAMWDSEKDWSSQAGKTKLSYVHHPTMVRKKIMQITKIWLDHNSNNNNK